MDGVWRPGPSRLLVLGIDTVVGANLALALAGRTSVLGLYQGPAVNLDGCQSGRWSRRAEADFDHAFRQHVPDCVLYCGPLAQNSWERPQVFDAKEEARLLGRLARRTAGKNGRLTVLSSDAVFCGPRMFHAENSPALAPGPFAQAVREAERSLHGTGALVARTHAYGWSVPGIGPGFAESARQSILENSAHRADPHSHATPIFAADLAELLWLAWRRPLAGLYHLAGAERTSAYGFARQLADVLGLRDCFTAPSPLETRVVEAGSISETSLSSRRAAGELQQSLPLLRAGLERFARQSRGWTARAAAA
jgi:dTDP-4-dehydrorhamnose reductase